MKTKLLRGFTAASIAWMAIVSVKAQTASKTSPAPHQGAAIPIEQLGTVAGKQYQGEGLSVVATSDGARLRCAFQRLEGVVTREGLWLSSTADNSTGERFRVMAVAAGRTTDFGFDDLFARQELSGIVKFAGDVARFIRPGLTEEYSVSVDGVRQDFIIEQSPAGKGELRVELDVTGAKAEPFVNGARLTLDNSGRKISYNRLHVTDARGLELTARLDVENATRMVVVVDDAAAIYPVRIDPTFSDANWFSMGGHPGVNGQVRAITVNGSGNIFIGGDFTKAGSIAANRIVKWNGSSWSALGLGLNDKVWALAVSGNDLYVGGAFTRATNSAGASVAVNYIAKWDGSVWSALGSGVDADVVALAVSGGDVYAGGYFGTAGGAAASSIAKWNGNIWSPLGSGVGGTVYVLAVSGSDVYAGGVFETAGGAPANYIAKWNGSSWSALGAGTSGYVYSIAASGSDVYAGGYFKNAGGNLVNNIAKWNGSSWSSLGFGIGGDYFPTAYALIVSGSNVYVGGSFTWATNSGGATVTVNGVGKWDGTNWSALGEGAGDVRAMAVFGSNVYAYAANNGSIRKWGGASWEALDEGLNSYVFAMAVSGSDVYAGGQFTRAGGGAAYRIAKWNGSNWAAVGFGLNGIVSALAVSGSNVFASGSFTMATNSGGAAITVNRIAKWNGNSWSALGEGMNGPVYALATLGSNLFAGGSFVAATNNGGGAVTANSIAKWNGSNWSALGLGVSGGDLGGDYATVSALAASGDDLYVGGNFATAGNISANHIAKWDGTNWSALGSGIGGSEKYVSALAMMGYEVFAGGNFTSIGGTTASRIARWDGSNWLALGDGVGGSVHALAVSSNDLYVGGGFTFAGSSTVNGLAKWDGSSWSALGSGVGYMGEVYALTASGSDLYVGGGFGIAGGKDSLYAAGAIINTGNWLAIHGGVPGPNTNTLTYVGIPSAQHLVQFATNLTTSPWFTLATNIPAANGRGTVQDITATNSQRFYRVSVP